MVVHSVVGRMCRKNLNGERFVIRLVRKVCDNSRAGSCDEKIKGMS